MLDTATNKLANYWNSVGFDDIAVVSIIIPSLGGKLTYKDHTESKPS